MRKKKKIYDIFDFVVTSIGVRSTKRDNDKKIFLKGLEMAKAKPEECIMIDDHQEKLDRAKEIGMKTILFQDVEQLREDLKKLGIRC